MTWQRDTVNWLTRSFVRPVFAGVRTPQATRKGLERFTRFMLRMPPLSLVLPATDGKMFGLWVSNTVQIEGVVLYFHGGAYMFGSPRTHAKMLAELARRSGARVFLSQYRLAPEHPFPAAFEDAVAAWDGLIAMGYAPRDIVLGGDSAGGGLALAVLAHVLHNGQTPAGLFAFSPWTDLTLSGASLVTNASREHVLAAHRFTEIRSQILGGARPQDADDPRLSPYYAIFHAPPPVQLHVAESEVLRDDTLRMRSRLPSAEIRLVGDLPHVWPMFHNYLPEARITLDQTAAFIRRCLGQPTAEN